MIVIDRRPGEKIVMRLPDGREFDIVLVGGHRSIVRICFAAPPDVAIWRGEIADAMRAKRQEVKV